MDLISHNSLIKLYNIIHCKPTITLSDLRVQKNSISCADVIVEVNLAN